MSEQPTQELPKCKEAPRRLALSVCRTEIKQFAAAVLEPAIGQAMGTLLREVEARLTAKIAALESAMSEFAYKGQWIEGKQYRRGNFVTLGSVWHAAVDTTSKPGSDSDWTLVIAKPRDGRDAEARATNGTGAPLPQPPEPGQRTVRSQR